MLWRPAPLSSRGIGLSGPRSGRTGSSPDFPFFSSVLDAGRAGPGFPTSNLTPRGLVLRIGRDHWVGFDTDLLRVAAIWRGKGVTPKALAPGSYHQPDKKTPGGQTALPEPDGKVWLANGIYPGWQTGERPSFDDPREPAPSPEEVGRGPLPEQTGRFKAIRQVRGGVVLEYTAGGADVQRAVSVVGTERQVDHGPPLSRRPVERGRCGSCSARMREDVRVRVMTRDPRAGHARRCRAVAERGSRRGRCACPRTTSRSSSPSRSRNGAASARRRRPPAFRPTPRAALAAGGHDQHHALDGARTPTSWTTSRCRSTIPGAATCALSDIQFMNDGTGVRA